MPTVPAELNLEDFEFYQDPAPALNSLRENHPVYWSEQAGCWFVSRYADVQEILANSEDAKANPMLMDGYRESRPLGEGALARTVEGFLITNDPPDHTRLRRHLSPALTPKAVRTSYVGLIETTVDALLDDVVDGETFDVVERLSLPLPLAAVCSILGFEPGDPTRLKNWTADITLGLEPLLTAPMVETGERAASEFEDFLRTTLRVQGERAAEGTILRRLVDGLAAGTLQTEQEAIARMADLVIAGTETTATAIPAALELLDAHPETWRELKLDPDLIPQAVEEFLRFTAPAAIAARIATNPITLNGGTIAPGEAVQVVIMAANRDPRVFAEPDTLDIRRNPNPHVTFGGGLHSCLGQHLARLELTVFLTRILERWDAFAVEREGVRRYPRLGVWGYSSFPAVVNA